MFGYYEEVATQVPNPQPYGSANDLPTVVKMRESLAGGKLLTFLVARDQRSKLKQLERDLDELVDTVDRFYAQLGPRHWIFTEGLPVPEVKAILDQNLAAEHAAALLMEVIDARVRSEWWRMGLFGHPAMRARQRIVERAREHYLDEQWDSCALQLVTVMDGFVNDVEPGARKGLHARDASDMVAWDSVVGHHMGLTAVMPFFLKTFKKRHDDEVFELHRHGIVHGTVINYNNQVVASKAWNMLAAVADWATALGKSSVAEDPAPTLRSTIRLLADHGKRTRYRDSFQPFTLTASDERFPDSTLTQAATRFLDAWVSGRWSEVSEFLPPIVLRPNSTAGQLAAFARETYEQLRPTSYEIQRVEFPQAHVGIARGTAVLNGCADTFEIRWLFQSANGDLAMPEDDRAGWVLAVIPPRTFFEGRNG